ncbi:hypothetical protein LPJ62_004778 [Coemansia sp. RSA 2167]|nr:hypothetical protein LPJ62_004778 [Coemansia sp. RSA 2167]KAJ2170930.1 hypothetical protein GGH16_003120 [Coemansia sp. RSA 560]KAJ2181394.1 hypothetical protein EV181_005232 [Coemansia sp. RSA 532]KAJ2207095.1 hypothetical protein IW145_001705 [Coemansia sp. RSA 521]KAJ2220829.1 hypothetical protein IW143_002079 [Coemansia sp. RSA 520]KAJ2229476.1 hypothetical protein EV180_001481 [Coemansia sp. RSA 518]KAJ2266275.1 hypothetical protein EV176_005657 [Coemansia sp. RSA 451]KAJ2404982.1 hy
MNNLNAIDTTMPVEAPDSPIWPHLSKRGKIDVSATNPPPLNIYYEIFGTGSTHVVFVNGMGADRQMWEPNIGEFLKHPEFSCLVYDHRGTGHSDHKSFASYTSSALATDLRNLLSALGWEKVSVVGASMGGMIALEFASSWPQLVHTLTLAVTNAGLSVPPLKGIVDTVMANFTSDPLARFKSICGSIYPREYLESPAPPQSGCSNMLEFCAQNAMRRSKYSKPMSFASFVGQVGTVFRHYVSPARLANLGRMLPGKRILIVTGDEDHLVRTSNSVYLADKIGREHVVLEVFEGAGHGLTSQESAKFVASIIAMIDAANANQA